VPRSPSFRRGPTPPPPIKFRSPLMRWVSNVLSPGRKDGKGKKRLGLDDVLIQLIHIAVLLLIGSVGYLVK
jgi:hypothetical protein